MEKTFPMTKEGLDKLKAELENLKLVKRPEVIDRIKVARSYGDLSENSEYEAAKDEQAFIEGRISTVETMIRYAEIVDNAKIAKDEVALGKNVTLWKSEKLTKNHIKSLVLLKQTHLQVKFQMNHQLLVF